MRALGRAATGEDDIGVGWERAAAPRQRLLAVAPGVIVLAQALWLRPRLAARTRQVVEGAAPAAPSPLHLGHVACEVAKLGALLALGLMAAGRRGEFGDR